HDRDVRHDGRTAGTPANHRRPRRLPRTPRVTRATLLTWGVASIGQRESPRRGRVRKQGHLPGVLDRPGDLPLLLHGDAGHAAAADLAAVGDELSQQIGVLVVDGVDPEERVGLLSGGTAGFHAASLMSMRSANGSL